MDTIIFYTELDKVIGCTKSNRINGDPFCDMCQKECNLCAFRGQDMNDIRHRIENEYKLKATFIKLYLDKLLRTF